MLIEIAPMNIDSNTSDDITINEKKKIVPNMGCSNESVHKVLPPRWDSFFQNEEFSNTYMPALS
jgi:hypothetical protein